jgi:hypothetical protein
MVSVPCAPHHAVLMVFLRHHRQTAGDAHPPTQVHHNRGSLRPPSLPVSHIVVQTRAQTLLACLGQSLFAFHDSGKDLLVPLNLEVTSLPIGQYWSSLSVGEYKVKHALDDPWVVRGDVVTLLRIPHAIRSLAEKQTSPPLLASL